MQELSDQERKEYILDLVEAVNHVSDEHGASDLDKLTAMQVLGDKAKAGSWYERSGENR